MTKKTQVEADTEIYVVALDGQHYSVNATSLEEAIELAKEKQAEEVKESE